MVNHPELRTYNPERQKRYETSVVNVAGENILYVTIPYKGCTQCPRCAFCGVQEHPDKNLVIDQNFGNEISTKTKDFVQQYQPDVLVLYNGGNILRPEEMYQPTLLKDIPEFVAGHPTLGVFELEARPDDIIKFQESIKTIKSNLKDKTLRMRLGIEFFDDKLLRKHNKDLTTNQIQQAVDFLNNHDITWNGYALLGGLDMDKDQAREEAIKTGKFVIDNQGYRLSINGVFVTERMQLASGKRIYVPDYNDLVYALKELYTYREQKHSDICFKAGFEEENVETVVTFPFVSDTLTQLEVMERLRKFDQTQNKEFLA